MSSLQHFIFFLLCFCYSASLRANNEIIKASATSFKVYWNVPSKLCRRYNVSFEKQLRHFGIIYNADEKFIGEKIIILYDPGLFPVVRKNKEEKNEIVNGGIPQSGDISQHITALKKTLDDLVPKNFSGVGVIDFEVWRPVFRQHWKHQVVYKNLSLSLVGRNNYNLKKEKKYELAAKEFEKAARTFFEETLKEVTKLRPNACWGYYSFPYCYNLKLENKAQCPKIAQEENDQIQWLFDSSSALYPSIYLIRDLSLQDIEDVITGRLDEAGRVWKNGHKRKHKHPVMFPYVTYIYTQTGRFLTEKEMETVLRTVKKYSVRGVIIWGSSENLRTKVECQELLKYVKTVLGPVILKIRKNIKT